MTISRIELIKNSLPCNPGGLAILDLGCENTQDILNICNQLRNVRTIHAVDDDRNNAIKQFFQIDNLELLSKHYSYLLRKIGFIDIGKIDLSIVKFFPISIEIYLENPKELSFDLIIFSNVIHFILNPNERIGLLNKISSSLSPNGILYVQAASDQHLDYNQAEDKQTFTKEMIIKEIDQTDLNIRDSPQKVLNSINWHYTLINKNRNKI